MARRVDLARIREELVDALKHGEEKRSRDLITQLGHEPRQVRTSLEILLKDGDARVRQAAAFGLGELGGAASVRRLEQQLALEEARGDYDGASVVEEITRALGRIQESGARTTLVRRLERVVAGTPDRGDVNELACALWRRRHPDLLPAVRRSLERWAAPRPNALHGLQVLLEKSIEELDAWLHDSRVPPTHKTGVVMLLEEDLPRELLPLLSAFVATAQTLLEPAEREDGEAAYYCECLFSMLLRHREQLLPMLDPEARSAWRAVARRLVGALSPNCSLRAVVLLKFIGRPEDAAVITTHRPAEPISAKVFDEAADALRSAE